MVVLSNCNMMPVFILFHFFDEMTNLFEFDTENFTSINFINICSYNTKYSKGL